MTALDPLTRINAIRDLRAHGIRAFEKAILFAIAARISPGSPYGFPSVRRLAGDAGMGETAARRVLRTLVAKGFVRVDRRAGGLSHYWIVDEALPRRDAKPSRATKPVLRVAMGRGPRRGPEGEQEGDHKGDHPLRGAEVESEHATEEPCDQTMAHFEKRFAAVKGCAPSPASAPRNRKAAATLLEHHSLEEVLAIIDRALADAWFVRNQGQLFQIASNPDRWRGAAIAHATTPNVGEPEPDFVKKLEQAMT